LIFIDENRGKNYFNKKLKKTEKIVSLKREFLTKIN